MRGTLKSIKTEREKFDDYLRKCGKRRTAERFAIFEMVFGISGHFTAESLGSLLREKDFPVSPATIYATLELLVDYGLLVRQRFADKAFCYERAEGNGAPGVYHHLVCSSCGKVKEVRDQAFNRIITERRYPGFTQSHFVLNIYGLCNSCKRKSKQRKSKNTEKK